MDKDFNHFNSKGKSHQQLLNNIYKANVGLVNEIKTLSKYYMDQLSDVDSGLEANLDLKEVNSNLSKLLTGISKFNEEIGQNCEDFVTEFEILIDSYQRATELYQSEKGELTALLTSRRELLYLEALINKFKLKINSLQLMNNALFSFSVEFKDIKEAYRSNLITISTAMLQSSKNCREMILKIEGLN